jgi:hypothetical protein
MASPSIPAAAPPDRRERSRYDPAEQRQAVRRGKERGAWVFVPAAELRAAGLDPAEPAPRYRVWAHGRGSIMVRLYRALESPPAPAR